jgi:hypothetical protein
MAQEDLRHMWAAVRLADKWAKLWAEVKTHLARWKGGPRRERKGSHVPQSDITLISAPNIMADHCEGVQKRLTQEFE